MATTQREELSLSEYLDRIRPEKGAITRFARRCGISTVYLSQLAAASRADIDHDPDKPPRQPGTALCVRIWKESGRVVSRQKLRRDWQRHWPELAKRQRGDRQPQVSNEASAHVS